MHKSRPCVIHKDLKPSNILLDQNLTSKLGDVGIASVAPELAVATFTGVTQRRGSSGAMRTSMFDSNPQGTPLYIDPGKSALRFLGPLCRSFVYDRSVALLAA